MPKLLAVSWAMPPLLFPRSIQVSRLLSGLADLGWDSRVVTGNAMSFGDNTFVDTGLQGLYESSYDLIPVKPKNKFWATLTRPVLEDMPLHDWARRALKEAQAEISVNKPDVIITFAQPWADFIIGLELKKNFPSLPWIAHFSDPWVDSIYHATISTEIRTCWERYERAVMENADRIVFVTEKTVDLVMDKYPNALREKVVVVPHMHDSRVLSDHAQNRVKKQMLRMSYIGDMFSGTRTPEPLFDALDKLPIDVSECIELSFMGRMSNEYITMARQRGLSDKIRFIPLGSYLDSMREIENSDVLLIVDAPSDGSVFFPSKLVEYLVALKPLIGITPSSGFSAQLVGECAWQSLEPNDIEGIVEAFTQMVEKWKTGTLHVSNEHRNVSARYDRNVVANQFDAILHSVV
ncbi:glycosyltransferase [Kiloniella majae]|uniref:glycosyltransferase n=1 Tax=Kiloniella majae TaxID=1938558 RepID=UPI000A2781F0|nr:glycosyltransferase [Kiloniella majae]